VQRGKDEINHSAAANRWAVRCFYPNGIRSVGIDQILSGLRISKAAFYERFECKEVLISKHNAAINRASMDTLQLTLAVENSLGNITTPNVA